MSSNIFFKKKNIKVYKLFPNRNLKKNFEIDSIKPLLNANKRDLTFFDSVKYKDDISKTKSTLCIVSEKLQKFLPDHIEKIIVKNVLFELARVTKVLFPEADKDYPDLSLKKQKNNILKKFKFLKKFLIEKKLKFVKIL